ncbi:hypothetical protein [Falsiroseomonas ponticola]|uniref:hypothetical protein n=1 Tax=Falsiroseomonas ponticola TaxID=2786951 RepID=UPI00193388E2|nr:hypothetical protein [Roseomonas ponticola]
MVILMRFALALALSKVSDRFAQCRQCTRAEADAIGTACMRPSAIPGPSRQEIAGQLRRSARPRTRSPPKPLHPPCKRHRRATFADFSRGNFARMVAAHLAVARR